MLMQYKWSESGLLLPDSHQSTAEMETEKEGLGNGAGGSEKDLPFRPRGLSTKGEASKDPGDNSSQKSAQISKTVKAKDSQKRDKTMETEKDQKDKTALKKPASDPHAEVPLPDFIVQRNRLFDELKNKRDAEVLAKDHPVINVVLDLGLDNQGRPRPTMSVAAKAWESTPGSFLRHVDRDISSDVVIAKVNGKDLWDLDRPLEYDCRVSYLPFTSAEGRNVFWHSSAHVLGEAAECQYQCLLSHGPPVEQGFFYDMALKDGYAMVSILICDFH